MVADDAGTAPTRRHVDTNGFDDGLGAIALVPPARLGRVLREHRLVNGRSLDEIAARSSGDVNVQILKEIEDGGRLVDDDKLALLMALYSITPGTPIADRSRLVIDLDGGFLHVDDRHARLGRHSGRRDVLLPRYLSLVYSMRGVDPGPRIPLRNDDLDVLGRALRLGTDTVRADLNALMENDPLAVRERMAGLSRRVLLPAAGVIVGICGLGTVLMVSAGADSPPAGESVGEVVTTVAAGGTPSSAGDVEISTAVVQERNPDGTPGPVRERIGG